MSKAETMMFVSVPGAEDVQEMPKSEVKAKMKTGDLPPEVVVWSKKNNEWKPPAAISSLIESPAAQPKAPVQAAPKLKATPVAAKPQAGTPKVAAQPRAATPKAAAPKATAAPRPQVAKTPMRASARPATSQIAADPDAVKRAVNELEAKQERSSGWIKWVCAFVGVIVFGLLLFNWFYVNVPLQENIAKTSFSETSAYGHLGGFFQANVLAMHVFDAPEADEQNFGKFITKLAASTPHAERWDFVTLTSGWMAEYGMSGEDWRRLGGMTGADQEDIKRFVIKNLRSPGSKLIMPQNHSMNYERTVQMQDNIWNKFAATMTHSAK